MNEDRNTPQDSIIPYVLGTLSEAEQSAFEAALSSNPDLSKQVDTARRMLSPLDAWSAPPTPSNLVDKVLIRAATTTPLEYVASSTSMEPVGSESSGKRRRFGMSELLGLAACIAILVGLYVPGMQSIRSHQLQALCGDNLASYGRGMSMYANESGGQLPNVGPNANSNWLNDPNRRHLLPAVRNRLVLPKHLICPAADGTIDEEATLKNIEAFLRRTDLPFWAVPNANGPTPRINIRITVPLAADANPLFQQGQFQRGENGTLTPNSRTHGGRGQNVLFNDGSTKFIKTPILGETNDNIWLADDIEDYQGTEAQQSATDAFLTP